MRALDQRHVLIAVPDDRVQNTLPGKHRKVFEQTAVEMSAGVPLQRGERIGNIDAGMIWTRTGQRVKNVRNRHNARFHRNFGRAKSIRIPPPSTRS